MTQLERQVRKAQHRLWFNRWLTQATWAITFGAVVYAGVVLVQRLWDLPVPLLWTGAGIVGIALLVSIIWCATTREDVHYAATMLDAAAGLRERVSSGLYCQESKDPFAQAVVTDAEAISTGMSVRSHLRLSTPRPLGWAGVAVVVAALMFLVSPGIMKRSEAGQDVTTRAQVEQTKAAVKKRLDTIRKMAVTNPALEDLKPELEELSKEPLGKFTDPSDIRHEAIKKIDKLEDAVKKKREDAKYDSVDEMRKMMRALKPQQDSKSPTSKLRKSLAQGDFKTAKEQLQNIRDQLATLKSEKDKELVQQLSKDLDDLAKKLEELAKNEEQMKQKLQEAGINKEDVERILEALKKKDIDQLKKELQKKGLNQQQADQLAKQLQQKQQACGQCQRMSQAMKQASQSCSSGQGGAAAGALSQAAEQLGELEQLQQEKSQLDSTMTDLQNAMNDINDPGSCSGDGTGQGQGKGRQGSGMGGLGRGRGGAAPEQETPVDFKVERGKVETTKGAIIGQFLVDGEQVKGDVTPEFAEVVTAAERDASDAVNRDRIPRQYQEAVKEYFSDVKDMVDAQEGDPKKKGSKSSSESKAESKAETSKEASSDDSND